MPHSVQTSRRIKIIGGTLCVWARAAFLLVVCVAVLFVTGKATAQDAHYWTFQYGPRSSLLGGAVIGSANDISATFYNPGALSQAEVLTFAVSTDIFERSSVVLENGGGEGVDLGTSRTGTWPGLVAVPIKKNLFGSGVLAYSMLTRTQGNQNLGGIVILSGEDIPEDVDLDDIAGEVRFEGSFSDIWAGLSYSHAFGSHFGLGVTWYGAARSQSRRRLTLSQVIATDHSGSINLFMTNGRYSTIRTLFKFGAFAAFGPVTGGLTLTTPSIHIAGSGRVGFNVSSFAPDSVSLATNVRTDLPATYKTPLSVGGGLGLQLGKARLYASAEWFDRIDPYSVLQAGDFRAQEPEDVVFTVDVVHALDEVFNWAVGAEYAFSSNVNGHLSYYTDNTGLTDNIERTDLSIQPFDINNAIFGADFIVGPVLVTLGGGYGWGRKEAERLTDLLRQQDEDFRATFVYRSFRLLFGFEIDLN